MIKFSRFISGLIAFICLACGIFEMFEGETLLISPYYQSAILIGILQIVSEIKTSMTQREKAQSSNEN